MAEFLLLLLLLTRLRLLSNEFEAGKMTLAELNLESQVSAAIGK